MFQLFQRPTCPLLRDSSVYKSIKSVDFFIPLSQTHFLEQYLKKRTTRACFRIKLLSATPLPAHGRLPLFSDACMYQHRKGNLKRLPFLCCQQTYLEVLTSKTSLIILTIAEIDTFWINMFYNGQGKLRRHTAPSEGDAVK